MSRRPKQRCPLLDICRPSWEGREKNREIG